MLRESKHQTRGEEIEKCLDGGLEPTYYFSIFIYSFETEDGMKRSEAGKHMEDDGMVQTGSWEYVGPDGRIYKVEYIADKNGFRPSGKKNNVFNQFLLGSFNITTFNEFDHILTISPNDVDFFGTLPLSNTLARREG